MFELSLIKYFVYIYIPLNNNILSLIIIYSINNDIPPLNNNILSLIIIYSP
jgi:hypothetical protein